MLEHTPINVAEESNLSEIPQRVPKGNTERTYQRTSYAGVSGLDLGQVCSLSDALTQTFQALLTTRLDQQLLD